MLSTNQRFQCCFWSKSIENAARDPVGIVIPLEGGGTQELFCHLACLRRVLHPSVPLGIFEDREEG